MNAYKLTLRDYKPGPVYALDKNGHRVRLEFTSPPRKPVDPYARELRELVRALDAGA